MITFLYGIVSLPINCSSGVDHVVTLEADEDPEILSETEENTLSARTNIWGRMPNFSFAASAIKNLNKQVNLMKSAYLAERCQTESVCQIPCGVYVKNCKKRAFFAKFTEVGNQTPAQKKTVENAYIEACIERKFDAPSQEFFLKNKLVQLVQRSHRFSNKNPFNGLEKNNFYEVLKTIKESKEQIATYLGMMGEILINLRRLCQQDPKWQEKVNAKIAALMVSTEDDLKKKFGGNYYLVSKFKEKIEDIAEIKQILATIIETQPHFKSVDKNLDTLQIAFQKDMGDNIKKGGVGWVCQ